MQRPRSNRIAEVRRDKKMSQQQLADAISVHWTTVSKLERGITKLDFAYAEEIANALGVEVHDLLPPRSAVATIALSGYVYHGGNVEAVEPDKERSFSIQSEAFYDHRTVWVLVKEDALYPYFKDGDLLGITWIDDEERRDADDNIDYTSFYGRFCLVEDGGGRQFMGIVTSSKSNETIDLLNANFPPLRNIKPNALGQVTVAIMPSPATQPLPKEDV